MSLFKTQTPDYKGQSGNLPRPSAWYELPDWLMQLFRTATPVYRKAPAHTARTKNDNGR